MRSAINMDERINKHATSMPKVAHVALMTKCDHMKYAGISLAVLSTCTGAESGRCAKLSYNHCLQTEREFPPLQRFTTSFRWLSGWKRSVAHRQGDQYVAQFLFKHDCCPIRAPTNIELCIFLQGPNLRMRQVADQRGDHEAYAQQCTPSSRLCAQR